MSAALDLAAAVPGAFPVELASSLGRRFAGNAGMMLSPVMIAVSAFVTYLFMDYILRMLSDCRKESPDRLREAVIVMTAVFLLVCGKNLGTDFHLKNKKNRQTRGIPFVVIFGAMVFMAAADMFLVCRFHWKPALTLFLNICIVCLLAFCGM